MEFRKGLKEELKKEGIDLQVKERIVDISSTDIVRLNNKIGKMIEDDERMLKQSAINAGRFPCD